jgi:hypothetical protein
MKDEYLKSLVIERVNSVIFLDSDTVDLESFRRSKNFVVKDYEDHIKKMKEELSYVKKLNYTDFLTHYLSGEDK